MNKLYEIRVIHFLSQLISEIYNKFNLTSQWNHKKEVKCCQLNYYVSALLSANPD